MNGQINKEYNVVTRKGQSLHLIDLEGRTSPPWMNYYYHSPANPNKSRFITTIHTEDGPNGETEPQTIVFWGREARRAKRLLMDSPRIAHIRITGARVSDPYVRTEEPLTVSSSISVNWPRQLKYEEFEVYDFMPEPIALPLALT